MIEKRLEVRMSESKVEPRVIGMDAWKTGPDTLVPGAEITSVPGAEITGISDVEGVWGLGLYFMPPGIKTTVFSMQEVDDGTADEYYGPCHEFYYLLVGEATMYWGEDASKVREGTADKLHLKAGDLGYWPKGWKYSVKNTGKMPVTWLWGITRAPKGTKTRPIYSRYTAQMPAWLR